MRRISIVLISVLVLSGLTAAQNVRAGEIRKGADILMKATFAGGCFWCMEPPFEKLKGVVSVNSGYTGGTEKDPTYEDVSSGKTGHTESVQILYDPKQITFEQLIDVYWRNINPTQANGQFVDVGTQYRSSIFYHNSEQNKLAEESKRKLGKSGRFAKSIVTEIVPVSAFYPAEEYHQDFYKKNPTRYHQYRAGSGRDQFIQKTWGNQDSPRKWESVMADKSEIKKRLTPLQYQVTQEGGTEPPFKNEHWNNHKPGIYVDVVSGEPLFASPDKFDSGTGWPSFTKPLEPSNIIDKEDRGLGMARTEVKSKHGNSHLGHVFPDGPAPTGLRYCINSAALRFVPVEDLEKQDYGQYRQLFK